MKKTILIGVLAMLCLNFCVQGQNKTNVNALKIGDQLPDITINNLINYESTNGMRATSANLADFKGKLLILDFWATWCSPCIAMIPKMDSLQKLFEKKIQFLGVAYQSDKEVSTFLNRYQAIKKTKFDVPDVVQDSVLSKLFPHTYLPHYVWIDAQGIVCAITDYLEVTGPNIQKMLNGQTVKSTVQEVARLPYNRQKPLFLENNGGSGENMVFHSLISSYSEGLQGGYMVTDPDSIHGRKLTFRNRPLTEIFNIAYGEGVTWFGPNKIKVESSNRDLLVPPVNAPVEEWFRQNAYSYELIVPASIMEDMYHIMQRDLTSFFTRYSVGVEKRNIKCLALVRTSKVDKLKTSGGKSETSFSPLGCVMQNFPLDRFVSQLDAIYMQKSPYPVIDDTGYESWVDLTVNANLSSKESVNEALAKYDLKFVEKEMLVPMLVIKDNPIHSAKN
jgi:thiol-disulfide isomerase/thioredoxin